MKRNRTNRNTKNNGNNRNSINTRNSKNKTRRIDESGSSYYTAAPGSIGSQFNLPQNQLNRERRMRGKRNSVQLRSSGMVNNDPQPLTPDQTRAWRNYNRYTRTHWMPN